jgi:hypothetical protein
MARLGVERNETGTFSGYIDTIAVHSFQFFYGNQQGRPLPLFLYVCVCVCVCLYVCMYVCM